MPTGRCVAGALEMDEPQKRFLVLGRRCGVIYYSGFGVGTIACVDRPASLPARIDWQRSWNNNMATVSNSFSQLVDEYDTFLRDEVRLFLVANHHNRLFFLVRLSFFLSTKSYHSFAYTRNTIWTNTLPRP